MMKQEREPCREANKNAWEQVERLRRFLNALNERDKCIRRLLPYVGEHHDDCETGLDEGCDCGLAAAVAEAEKMLEGSEAMTAQCDAIQDKPEQFVSAVTLPGN